MSDKINSRSPFYLTYTTPTVPSPEFTCVIANAIGFKIDQEGIITEPQFDYGQVVSFTSSDSGFSNEKYAVVTSDTLRTVVFRVSIPSGFSNSSTGFLDCSLQFTQPKKVTTGTTPSCSGGPTTNGNITVAAINTGGKTTTVDLSAKFTQGTSAIAGYRIQNYHPGFMSAAIVGNTLTITSLNLGGVETLHVTAFDNDSNTCTATQSFTVTINAVSAFTCTKAGLVGGSISQTGVITDPNLIGTITARKLTSGGSALSGPPYNAGANNTSSSTSKTIFFDVTAPGGYTNTGATLECSKSIDQPGTSLSAFTCNDLTLTEQGVYTDGTIKKGKTSKGTIASFSPLDFDVVSVPTDRTIFLSVTAPANFSNAGSNITCSTVVKQPPELNVCNYDGGGTFYISYFNFSNPDLICNEIGVRANVEVFSTAEELEDGYGKSVCRNGQPMKGFGQFYVVDTFINNNIANRNSGPFYVWQISNSGIIESVTHWDCDGGGQGQGYGFF
jgi:hypothetical protein